MMMNLTQLSGNLGGITGKIQEKFTTLRTSEIRLSKEKRSELLGKFQITLTRTKEGLSKFIMEL
jgi:hypothetical protein